MSELFGNRPQRRTIHDETKNLIQQPLEERRFLFRGIAAVVQQMMVQINFDRTRFGAAAAER